MCVAAKEVDLIAGFDTNSNEMREKFDSTSGINSQCRRSIGQSDAIGKSRGSILVGHAEIIEAHFAGHEYLKRTSIAMKLGAEETVEDSEVGAADRSSDPVRERAGVVLLEIVGHFGLDLGVSAHPDGKAASETEEILCCGGVGIAEQFAKRTDFDAVVGLRHEGWSDG